MCPCKTVLKNKKSFSNHKAKCEFLIRLVQKHANESMAFLPALYDYRMQNQLITFEGIFENWFEDLNRYEHKYVIYS